MITELETDEPISDAKIHFQSEDQSFDDVVNSDETGSANLGLFPQGTVLKIDISKDGYEAKILEDQIVNDILVIPVALKKVQNNGVKCSDIILQNCNFQNCKAILKFTVEDAAICQDVCNQLDDCASFVYQFSNDKVKPCVNTYLSILPSITFALLFADL